MLQNSNILTTSYSWLSRSFFKLKLINIGQNPPRDEFTVFSPNLSVLVCAPSFISSFSPYQQNQKVYRIHVRNWGTACIHSFFNFYFDKRNQRFKGREQRGSYLIPHGKLKDSASNKSPRQLLCLAMPLHTQSTNFSNALILLHLQIEKNNLPIA